MSDCVNEWINRVVLNSWFVFDRKRLAIINRQHKRLLIESGWRLLWSPVALEMVSDRFSFFNVITTITYRYSLSFTLDIFGESLAVKRMCIASVYRLRWYFLSWSDIRTFLCVFLTKKIYTVHRQVLEWISNLSPASLIIIFNFCKKYHNPLP